MRQAPWEIQLSLEMWCLQTGVVTDVLYGKWMWSRELPGPVTRLVCPYTALPSPAGYGEEEPQPPESSQSLCLFLEGLCRAQKWIALCGALGWGFSHWNIRSAKLQKSDLSQAKGWALDNSNPWAWPGCEANENSAPGREAEGTKLCVSKGWGIICHEK